VDDAPQLIRQTLDRATRDSTELFEERNLFRLVDAYSWGAGGAQSGERYAVTGILELNQLSGVVQDAGVDLGQTVRNRLGGRRVLDSISSLLINFELPSVQRFPGAGGAQRRGVWRRFHVLCAGRRHRR
jgi:hypothetical protein